jgi:uncharacterized protein DUF4340
MKAGKTLVLGAAAAVLLLAGLFVTLHRSSEQADLGGGPMFADLKTALGEVQEIRLSKGDGSKTTLRKDATGWTVVERQFPADTQRVRELALGLADLRVVERKTADPANYPRLGVEDPSPTATSTLVEVVAGKKSWSLLVGKSAEGRSVYVRKPADKTSLLAAPLITADPDQKRWIDRLIVDLPGSKVHEISAKVGAGPAYVLTRAQPGAADLTLSPVPKGRAVVSNMVLGGQAEALASFNFDDLHAATGPANPDTATYRTFDGQVITFTGHREADKAYIAVHAERDPALAAQFAPAPSTAPAPATAPATATPAPAPVAEKPVTEDKSVERIAARGQGVEFEIPVYKYESIFKPYDDLLEKPAAKAPPGAPAKARK